MNKFQIISQANKLLDSKGFKSKDYSVSPQGPDIILTVSGDKKMTEEIRNQLLDIRVNILGAEGKFTPEVRQATKQPQTSNGAKPKVEKESVMVETLEEMGVGKKFETSLKSPLEVFSKKDIVGKPAKMQPCSAIIYSKLAEVDEEGNSVISVKKPGSTRVFYTTENRINQTEVTEVADEAVQELIELADEVIQEFTVFGEEVVQEITEENLKLIEELTNPETPEVKPKAKKTSKK